MLYPAEGGKHWGIAVRRFEKLFVGAALFAAAIAMVLTAAAVGVVLTPENNVWENARPGVVIAVAMLIAYPFLKKRSRNRS
jgi:hypothetical protein